MSAAPYNPKEYWGNLVAGNSSLSNVGHETLGKYNDYAYAFRLEAVKKALQGIDLRQARIFEAAFGECFYLKHWHAWGARQVAGMDISEAAVQSAKKLFPADDLRTGDLADASGFEGLGEFDLVTAIDVLYHIVDDKAWRAAVHHLAGLVKKNGRLLITDKFPCGITYQTASFVRRRPLAVWDEALRQEGLVRTRILPMFVWMDDAITCGEHPVLGAVSLFQWKAAAKLIRLTARRPRLQNLTGTVCALLQWLPEKISLSLLKRTPNLELVVYTKS
jgi:SAM-dependent methyltransferase